MYSLRRTQAEQEKLRGRIQEMKDSVDSIELELVSLRTQLDEGLASANTGREGREKILEGRMDDLDHRLRLGMNNLQVTW